MPHTVSVRCPVCRRHATFEHAKAVPLRRKKDVQAFKKSRDFDVVRLRAAGGGYTNGALYYHGLRQRRLGPQVTTPAGYDLGDWRHSPYAIRSQPGDLGTVVCDACGLRRKHRLDWPSDAYFQVSYRGQVLWAFNREMAAELLRYVRASDRNRRQFRFQAFLMKVPTHFLTAKARETVADRLEKALMGA